MRKTLYFDIKTVAKIIRLKKKTGVSESKIVRHAVNRAGFEELLVELREDFKHSQFIKDKNLLK